MSILLTDLLERVPKEVEGRVRATRDRARNVLRDAIRAECRLAMRTDAEDGGATAQVPIEVLPGYPEALKALSFPNELRHVLLLTRFRRSLAEAASGTAGLLQLHEALTHLPSGNDWTRVNPAAISDTREWALEMLRRLDAHDPVGKILMVNEDILGAYIYRADVRDEFATNNARIALYWCVIGLVSDWLGCSVEDLTVVVMAHELAHAYTQLGADIEGRRWPSHYFGLAETDLKEGLAQFYTLRALQRMHGRFPGAIDAFETLLVKQPGPYHAHEPWTENFSPEAVRQAMLEVRRWREGSMKHFTGRLLRAGEQLMPLKDSLF
jgi:hypothetical protein